MELPEKYLHGDGMLMTSGPYMREPLDFRNDIPCFSVENEYTRNYEKISQDHLVSFYRDGSNPFIPEDMWVSIENSTIELVKKYARAGQKILDVGVGMGRLLSHFPELERYGMDISFGYLNHARANGIDACYALIEDMPYRDEYFDIVVCTDVLEHVLDLNLCVTNILRPLKTNGLLFVRTPYREGLECYASSDLPYEYVHLRNFDEHALRLLFTRIFRNRLVEYRFATHCDTTTVRPTLGAVLNRIKQKFRKKPLQPLEINVVVQKV